MGARVVLLVICLACAAEAQYPYPLGPFSRLAKYPEGWVCNGYFEVCIERGFKLHGLLPETAEPGIFGKAEYAGFLTLETGPQAGARPLYLSFAEPGDGTQTITCDPWRLAVAKVSGPWRQEMALYQGYPFTWLSAQGPADASAITWLLMGYGWAGKQPPDQCQLLRAGGRAPTTARLARSAPDPLPSGAELGAPLVLLRGAGEGFQLALVFTASPLRIFALDDGVAFELPMTRGQAAPFAVAVLPVSMAWADAARLVPTAFARPTARRVSFGCRDGRPWVRMEQDSERVPNQWRIAGQAATPLPVTLADRAPEGALRLPTLLGGAALCLQEPVEVALEPVERIAEVGPPVVDMRAEWREKVNRYAAEVVAHLRPSGGFTSSQGRPFYDGLTCSGLLLARPYLDAELQQRADEAVRRTLDLWWANLRLDGEVGIWYFPEPAPSVPQVDYPEISATLLWPTVQYAAQVDESYPRTIQAQIGKLASTLPLAYDWTGAAYAHPGPEYNHVIVESVIGGFVAWCALNRLATMLGHAEMAAECAARASFAREAIRLLRWRDGYDEGLVSEILPNRIKTKITEAWCYTMYTWFSFVPAFELPAEDVYRVWSTLEGERWWDYSIESKQRCYDFAHLMALARYGHRQEGMARLAAFEDRPFGFESFDSTPVYALMAYPWTANDE